MEVSKVVKIRNRYNQVSHLTQDTNGKVTNSQLDTTNESQEVSTFQAGDHKAHINRRAQRHSNHNTEKKTYVCLFGSLRRINPCGSLASDGIKINMMKMEKVKIYKIK